MSHPLPSFAPVPVLAVVGLGLLGGSVALAARRCGFASRIIGVGRDEDRLRAAQEKGIIDQYFTDEAAALREARWVVLANPVEVICEQLPRMLALASPGAVITDVGSTKEAIVSRADERPHHFDCAFVGSHPMAGSDKTGWENASADLFRNATAFVTVTPRTPKRAASHVALFWRALGARPLFVGPRRHDQMVAILSHVPHLTAVALMEQLHRSGEDPNLLRILAGPGLRDTTRVAKGSPDVWEQICLQNSHSIAEMLDAMGGRCHELARMIREEDSEGLRQTLVRARDLRKALEPGT